MKNDDNAKSRAEKRDSHRFYLPLKVKYKIVGKKQIDGQGKCVNISRGGMRIWASHDLKTGDLIEITFPFKNFPKKPITAQGKVVWTGKSKGTQFDRGIEFTNIKLQSKFIEFLCSEMIDQSLQ